MIKKLFPLLFIISLLSFSACANQEAPTNNEQPEPTSSETTEIQTPLTLTMEELAKHNLEEDCWLLINGNVYDVTNYFGSHPGGDSFMLEGCGIDATELYSSPHSHSSNANNLLENYLLGPIE